VGAAYVFEEDDAGNWSQDAKLTPRWEEEAWFGWDVAIDGDRASIGAPRDNTLNGRLAGSVYAFSEDEDGAWTDDQRLIASDGEPKGWLGWSVDVDGATVVASERNDFAVVTDPGAAYVFARQADGVWSEQRLVASAQAPVEWEVAVDDGTVLAGVPLEPDVLAQDVGSVHVFRGVGAQASGSLE